MSKQDCNSKADLLIKVIDLAISCFTNIPPEGWEESHIKQFVNTYLDYKSKVVSPEPRFKNVKSLNQIRNDILIYFQEGSGKTVDAFWNEIYTKKFDIKRVNKFKQLLKRGKIKNHNEYDLVIDLYNAYIESKMLSKEEVDQINDLISSFEKSSRLNKLALN